MNGMRGRSSPTTSGTGEDSGGPLWGGKLSSGDQPHQGHFWDLPAVSDGFAERQLSLSAGNSSGVRATSSDGSQGTPYQFVAKLDGVKSVFAKGESAHWPHRPLKIVILSSYW
jgi:hypothetical protein